MRFPTRDLLKKAVYAPQRNTVLLHLGMQFVISTQIRILPRFLA
jgi:hypothetical protein